MAVSQHPWILSKLLTQLWCMKLIHYPLLTFRISRKYLNSFSVFMFQVHVAFSTHNFRSLGIRKCGCVVRSIRLTSLVKVIFLLDGTVSTDSLCRSVGQLHFCALVMFITGRLDSACVTI